MEQFHFEQPIEKKPLTLEERAEVVTSPEEIAGQLAASQARYGDALAKLRAGNRDDRDYLEETQTNLIAWKNAFDIRFGALGDEEAFIRNEVLARLAEVSHVLEEVK